MIVGIREMRSENRRNQSIRTVRSWGPGNVNGKGEGPYEKGIYKCVKGELRKFRNELPVKEFSSKRTLM